MFFINMAADTETRLVGHNHWALKKRGKSNMANERVKKDIFVLIKKTTCFPWIRKSRRLMYVSFILLVFPKKVFFAKLFNVKHESIH